MSYLKWLGIAGAVILCVVGFTWNAAGNFNTRQFDAVPAKASAHVKIALPSGYGSGTHIGRGYILTAAHVVSSSAMVEIKTDNGQTFHAERLWFHQGFDVALLRIYGEPSMESVPVACAPPQVGQHIQTFGNPIDVPFVYSRGEIIGKPMAFNMWRSVVPVDGTGAPGQSGAGAISDGKLIGIHVGGLRGGDNTRYGYSFVVPASVFCDLRGIA